MDPVLYWNQVAIESNRIDFSGGTVEQGGPTRSSRAMAIAHLAMHDAYFLVAGGHPPNLPGLPAAPGGAVAIVAGARAMYRALIELYPAQRARLDLAWQSFGQSHAASEAFGEDVAAAHLASRAGDQVSSGMYSPAARCDHRPDPLNPNQGYHGITYGNNPLFAGAADQLLKAHPGCQPGAPDHAAYLASLERVRDKGRQSGSTRSVDETIAGLYWAYDGASQIGTPPRLYNQIVQAVISKAGTGPSAVQLTDAQKVRLFALVNCAMGNAGIRAWANKYHYRLWRPILGVREYDSSLGPQAVADGTVSNQPGDPFWVPLGAPRTNSGQASFTPDFPAYPSGHATFGSAVFQVLRNFFHAEFGKKVSGLDKVGSRKKDKLGFIFVSDELNGLSTDARTGVRVRHKREFASLWDAVRENGLSRIYLGVHWDFDAFLEGDDHYSKFVGGIPLGLDVADDLATNGMRRA